MGFWDPGFSQRGLEGRIRNLLIPWDRGPGLVDETLNQLKVRLASKNG